MSSPTPSSRLHPQTFWCHECDMSISLLPSPSPLPCPHCLRLDSLLPLDSISPLSPSNPNPNPNLSMASHSLPSVQIADAVSVCAICKDDLPRGSLARRLPCSHHYHADCILPWLSLLNSCPLCRFRVRLLRPDDVVVEVSRMGVGMGMEEEELADVIMADVWEDLLA